MISKLAALLPLALLAQNAHGFWILSHHALNYQRLDPIVNPGAVSPHVHSIIGSNAFAPTMDYAKTQTATCTTSPVQDDLSSYWAQSLYHKAANGTFTLIPISFVQTYYLQRDGPTQKEINAFPEGLRMVAGNPYRTAYNESNIEDHAINFVCLDYDDKTADTGPLKTLPTRPCKDGMRMQVNFPSCWDGKNLDSADHKSHMSYPVGGAPDSGDCPASHPVKTILLFNEYVYDVGKFDFQAGQDSWVTATGDSTGLSFHADFINGWKKATLDAAVKQCTAQLFGDLEKCPPFAASLNRDKAGACKLDAVVEENVLTPGNVLPGCNKYTPGKTAVASTCPGLAVPAIKGGAGATVLPGAPASTSASSVESASTAAHSASSSAAATSPAQASTSSAAAGTGSPASSSAAGTTSVAINPASSSSTAAAATSAVSSKHHGHTGHHLPTAPIRNVSGTQSGAQSTATAIKGGKQCKRDVARDAAKAAAETKYKRAVQAHHAGVKNRMAGH